MPNMARQFPYPRLAMLAILHTCNTDQQETWSSEIPAVFSLYQSVHEPSDISLVLKKKQHNIQYLTKNRVL